MLNDLAYTSLAEWLARLDARMERIEAGTRKVPDDVMQDALRYQALKRSGKFVAATICGGWGLAVNGPSGTDEELDAAADELIIKAGGSDAD